MRYFTSDHHFGHKNIITYCARPYFAVSAMDADMVIRWNSVVGDDDEVIVLGDLALGVLEESLQVASKLRGHKILVPGNHDKCWTGKKKGPNSRGLYKDAGFKVVDRHDPILLAGQFTQLDHFPFSEPSWSDHDKFAAHRPTSRGQWLLHGHIHEKWRQRGHMINVGVDAWGGYPVAEETLAGLVVAGPADLAPLEWAS
jgi:calcineurin-like phosphoesterase family protein